MNTLLYFSGPRGAGGWVWGSGIAGSWYEEVTSAGAGDTVLHVVTGLGPRSAMYSHSLLSTGNGQIKPWSYRLRNTTQSLTEPLITLSYNR